MKAAAEGFRSKAFQQYLTKIRSTCFSRDPELWPTLSPAPLQNIHSFFLNSTHKPPVPEDFGSEGEQLAQDILGRDFVPQSPLAGDPMDMRDTVNKELRFVSAMSKNWTSPRSVENVATMPADPALHGMMMGLMTNPNLVHVEYSGMSAKLEQVVARQMSSLVGYDPDQSFGLFTQGGTFANLYGYLLGMRKTGIEEPESGLKSDTDYRFIHSVAGHYSNHTALATLGVNSNTRAICCRVDDRNSLDVEHLEKTLEMCYRLNIVVPTIMLTMGTTDTFGVDPLRTVREIVDRLSAAYNVENPPHIHVDTAVGWPVVFFNDYDFERNPLGINDDTLEGIEHVSQEFKALHLADSFTIDFHKWGYVPYTSTMLLVKNKADMNVMAFDEDNFHYFNSDSQGLTHYHSTIECSRSGTGIFGAYAALNYMGVEGFQVLIANSLQNAQRFRALMQGIDQAHVVWTQRAGPCVGWRLYPKGVDPNEEFAFETQQFTLDSLTTDYDRRVNHNTAFHNKVFNIMNNRGLYTNWIRKLTHSNYVGELDSWRTLPGEKAVFFHPLTDEEHLLHHVELLQQTIDQVNEEHTARH